MIQQNLQRVRMREMVRGGGTVKGKQMYNYKVIVEYSSVLSPTQVCHLHTDSTPVAQQSLSELGH